MRSFDVIWSMTISLLDFNAQYAEFWEECKTGYVLCITGNISYYNHCHCSTVADAVTFVPQ